MFRKFAIATGILALLTAPSMAANWYVLKGAAHTTAAPDTQPCYVADRMASGAGEQQVAGPYPTQAAGERAMLEQVACKSDNLDDS